CTRRWDENDRLARRTGDPAAAPWPKSAYRPEHQGFLSLVADDEHALAGLQLDVSLDRLDGAGRGGDREVVHPDAPVVGFRHFDWPAFRPRSSIVESVLRKLATRRSVARQSAMLGKLSTNHRSDCCTWLNAPTSIMSSPKVMPLLK